MKKKKKQKETNEMEQDKAKVKEKREGKLEGVNTSWYKGLQRQEKGEGVKGWMLFIFV